MASINYAAREISVKIVYYGPGLSGKTTNLQVIHRKVPPEFKSDMVSLATETDRTLFFDFLPLDLGKIKGFATKFQLYTVPGQVYYNATRKLVLRGVDGVVFVADSGADKIQENLESFQNLEENLAEYGYQRENIPTIIQYNKRDLPNALPIEELQRLVNKYNLPWSEAVANKGKGVFDSLKLIGKIVIDYLNRKYSRQPRNIGAQDTPAMRPVQDQRRPAAAAVPPPQQFQQRPQQPAMPGMGGGYQPPRPMQQPQGGMRQMPQQPTRQPGPPPVQQARPAYNPMQQPARPQAPARQPSYPPQQPQYGQRPAPAANQFDDAATFEPAGNAGGLAQGANQVPSEGYFDYGNISLEPMGGQGQPQMQSAPAPQQDYGAQQQGKTDLDLEIEKYQREIEEKQRKMRTQPHAAPQQAMPPQMMQPQMPPQSYSPTPAQRPAFPGPSQAPAPTQPLNQGIPAGGPQRFAGRPQMPPKASQEDYDVYNLEVQRPPQAPPAARQAQPSPPPIDEGDDMYFTSVSPDRQRKPQKRPVNPRTQQQKGFLSKLFNRENP